MVDVECSPAEVMASDQDPLEWNQKKRTMIINLGLTDHSETGRTFISVHCPTAQTCVFKEKLPPQLGLFETARKSVYSKIFSTSIPLTKSSKKPSKTQTPCQSRCKCLPSPPMRVFTRHKFAPTFKQILKTTMLSLGQ